MKSRFFVIFLFVILSYFPAYAHSPYLLKQKIIKDNEGDTYILEKRNGDSVIGFSRDPYVLQIRTMSGHVVAMTRAQLPIYCLSLEDCRALGSPGPVRFDDKYIKQRVKEISD